MLWFSGGYTTDFVFYERRCARDGLSSGSCISEPAGVQEVVQATVDDLGIRGRVTSGRLCHCDNALCNDNVIPTIESTGSTPSRPAMITCAALLILKLLWASVIIEKYGSFPIDTMRWAIAT